MPTSSQAQARSRDNPSGASRPGASPRTYHTPIPSPPSSQAADPSEPKVNPTAGPHSSENVPPGHTGPVLASHAAPTVSDPGAGILEALAEVQAEANHWQDQHTSLETQLAATLARVAALEHVYSPLLDRVKDLEEEIKDLKFREKSLLKKTSSTKVEGGAEPILGELGATPLPSSDEDRQSSDTDDEDDIKDAQPRGSSREKGLGHKVPVWWRSRHPVRS